jgi:hypothetical protein
VSVKISFEDELSAPTENLAIYFKNILVTVTDGEYSYGTVGSMPSTLLNSPTTNFRMWNFCLAFELFPTRDETYTITLDGTRIDPKPVKISFEDELSGVFTIQSKTFNAHKYITYQWNKDDPFFITLSLKLRVTSPRTHLCISTSISMIVIHRVHLARVQTLVVSNEGKTLYGIL